MCVVVCVYVCVVVVRARVMVIRDVVVCSVVCVWCARVMVMRDGVCGVYGCDTITRSQNRWFMCCHC